MVRTTRRNLIDKVLPKLPSEVVKFIHVNRPLVELALAVYRKVDEYIAKKLCITLYIYFTSREKGVPITKLLHIYGISRTSYYRTIERLAPLLTIIQTSH